MKQIIIKSKIKMEKCRACLESTKDLIPMDERILQGFTLLTGLSVSMTPHLYICITCNDAINFFIYFRNKCIQSDAELKNIFQNELQESNNALLKDEIKLEFVVYKDVSYDKEDEVTLKLEQLDSITQNEAKSIKTKTPNKLLKRKSKSKNETKLILHEKHSQTEVHCGLCDSKFNDRSHLNQHLEYHKSHFNTQMTCGLCTERFTNLPHMLGHRLEHVPNDQKLCHICSKKFVASSSICLEFHYMKVHCMANEDDQIQCKLCNSSYPTSRKLIRHIRDSHTAPKVECQLCKKRNRTLLNVHTKMKHTESERVKCELCDFTSKYPNSLMLHTRRKHTSNTYTCKACYRVFVDEASLTRHVAGVCKHHTRVVCSVCGHTVKKVWLKHHMRSHNDEYPFKCDKCPAQYKYRTGLKDHKSKHEGTFTFNCDLCEKTFCIKSALQSHRRTHKGDKPFICDICKVGFKRRYNLKAHMNSHPWTSSEHSKEINIQK